MELKDVLEKLGAIGRVNAKPAKAPKSTDPVDKFKIDLEKQITDADFYAKNGFPTTKSASRWISAVEGGYSVKFGNPAVAVGEEGNKYFPAKDLKEAKAHLEMGRVLLTDPDFQTAVRNAKSKTTAPVAPVKTRKPRKPRTPKV